jgi:hypothetical protein
MELDVEFIGGVYHQEGDRHHREGTEETEDGAPPEQR